MRWHHWQVDLHICINREISYWFSSSQLATLCIIDIVCWPRSKQFAAYFYTNPSWLYMSSLIGLPGRYDETFKNYEMFINSAIPAINTSLNRNKKILHFERNEFFFQPNGKTYVKRPERRRFGLIYRNIGLIHGIVPANWSGRNPKRTKICIYSRTQQTAL